MSIGKIIEKLGPETDLDSKTLWHWISREVEWALQTILISKRGKMKKTSFQHNISLRNLVFPKKEKNIDANCILISKKSWESFKGDEKCGIFVGANKWIHFPWKQFFSQTGGKSVTKFPWSRLLCTTTVTQPRMVFSIHNTLTQPRMVSSIQKIGGSTDVYWS